MSSDTQAAGQAAVEEALSDDVKIHETPADEAAEIQQAASKAGGVEMVPLSLIQKSDVALRGVNRSSEPFQLLVESIRKRGVLNSILVRAFEDNGVTKYGLIDGLQRFTASGDAGLTEIPARVVEMNDAELLEAQIITNMNRVQTKPAELAKHLLRIMARNPFMTKSELAEKTCQSLSWIEQRLSLTKLKPEIQELVNTSKINLSNAYILSKLPEEEQGEHVDAAMSDSPTTFIPQMKARIKEIRDAKNTGKDAGKAEFKPVQHLQKVGTIKGEFSALAGGKGESRVKALLKEHKVTDAVKAAEMALSWALNFDPASQKEQLRKHEVKAKKRAEQVEKNKAEREEKKAADAAKKAADITTL